MTDITPVNESTFKISFDKDSEVIVGGETDDFKPEAKLKRWGEECFIRVNYPTTEKITPTMEDNKVKWVSTDKEIHFYPIKIGEKKEIDAFEFEVILKKKPATNKIVLNIESQGLNFYYQPELTQKEIDEGAFRPENVIGSYAVYHATKGNMHPSQEEAEKYKVGKAFHIYRPRINDAEGNLAWEELKIEDGLLTITIPQDFLDEAVYPISSKGTTFGNEVLGSSSTYYSTNRIEGSWYSSTETGTLTKLTVGVSGPVSANGYARPVVFLKSDGSVVGWGAEITRTQGDPKDFYDYPLESGSLGITATDYWLTLHEYATYSMPAWYDNTTANKGIDVPRAYHATNDPVTVGATPATQNIEFSIYATYTPGNGTTSYTLEVAAAAFVLTGITLSFALGMATAVGSFALTGIDTILTKALKMAAAVGSFALTGIAASFTKALSITASVGSFTLTGIDVLLKRVRRVLADVGVFVLTGVDAALTKTARAIFTRKVSPYSKKAIPYSRKSTPYSKKLPTLIERVAYYSKQIICPFLLQENWWPLRTEDRKKIRL